MNELFVDDGEQRGQDLIYSLDRVVVEWVELKGERLKHFGGVSVLVLDGGLDDVVDVLGGCFDSRVGEEGGRVEAGGGGGRVWGGYETIELDEHGLDVGADLVVGGQDLGEDVGQEASEEVYLRKGIGGGLRLIF